MPRQAKHVDLQDLGPAMCALDDRQRDFVLALLDNGGNQTCAAFEAGYAPGGDRNTHRAQGSRLVHNIKIQAAILEVSKARIRSSGVKAVSVLIEIMEGTGEGTTTKDRLKAAQLLMDRQGLHALTEHKTTVEHTIDPGQLVDRIKHLSEKLGIEIPKKLLGRAAAVEAELVVVPADDDVRLEDLL